MQACCTSASTSSRGRSFVLACWTRWTSLQVGLHNCCQAICTTGADHCKLVGCLGVKRFAVVLLLRAGTMGGNAAGRDWAAMLPASLALWPLCDQLWALLQATSFRWLWCPLQRMQLPCWHAARPRKHRHGGAGCASGPCSSYRRAMSASNSAHFRPSSSQVCVARPQRNTIIGTVPKHLWPHLSAADKALAGRCWH